MCTYIKHIHTYIQTPGYILTHVLFTSFPIHITDIYYNYVLSTSIYISYLTNNTPYIKLKLI